MANKYFVSRIFKLHNGEELSCTEYNLKGVIEVSIYEKEIADKDLRRNYLCRCPGSGLGGEQCQALLEFTRGSTGRASYFSAKDSSEHVDGCVFASDGKRRIQTNENYIYKDLDPFTELSRSKRYGSGNASGPPRNPRDDDTRGQRREGNTDGFKVGMVERYLKAGPQWAVKSGVLISHLCICRRTYRFFTENFFRMEKGDPMVIVGDYFDWFSDSYGYRIAGTYRKGAFVLSEHYSGDKEFLYIIKIDKMPYNDREKVCSLLDTGGSNKSYMPFVAGAIYEKTIEDYVAKRTRIMHIFSMYRAEFLIEFDTGLQKLDNNNLTF